MKQIKLITFSLFLLSLFACLYFVVDMQTAASSANNSYTNHKIAHHSKHYDVSTPVFNNLESRSLDSKGIKMQKTYQSLKLKAVNTSNHLLSMHSSTSNLNNTVSSQVTLKASCNRQNHNTEMINPVSFSSLATPRAKTLQSSSSSLHATAMFADASGHVPTADHSDDMTDPAMPLQGEWYCMLCLVLIFGMYKHYKLS